MFFETTDDLLYPVARIRCIGRPRKHPKGYADIHTVDLDDTQVEIFATELERLRNHPLAMVAAAPDTFIVKLLAEVDGNNPEIFKTPVVAWAVNSRGETMPVTVDGVNDGNQESHAILLPSGQVQEPMNTTHTSFEAFSRSELDDYAKKRKP